MGGKQRNNKSNLKKITMRNIVKICFSTHLLFSAFQLVVRLLRGELCFLSNSEGRKQTLSYIYVLMEPTYHLQKLTKRWENVVDVQPGFYKGEDRYEKT